MKNFKRLTAILAISALCVGTAFTSFAEESPQIATMGEPNEEGATVYAPARTESGAEVTAEELAENVKKQIDTQEELVEILENANLDVPKGAKVSVIAAAEIDADLPEGGDWLYFTVDDPDVEAGDILYVLHLVNGVWEVYPAEVTYDKFGNLQIGAFFDSLSPVAIVKVMKNGKVLELDPVQPRTSPKTGA